MNFQHDINEFYVFRINKYNSYNNNYLHSVITKVFCSGKLKLNPLDTNINVKVFFIYTMFLHVQNCTI